MEGLMSLKDARIEALQKELETTTKELERAKELLLECFEAMTIIKNQLNM
tara:strand:- start:983 stop:1132 length:150 start_codon:yes stop_codon:yes gene_type:complete